MDQGIKKSRLFAGMIQEELDSCLTCSGAVMKRYEKNQMIFRQSDRPDRLYVMVEGQVSVCRDSAMGKRTLVAAFNEAGDLFGEVYVFLEKKEYDYYAVADSASKVLEIPGSFLYRNCPNSCTHHTVLIRNMLSILAEKAYYLNQKLQILSCSSLRRKIAAVLLKSMGPDGKTDLKMNREELADYLGVARPSLSRELMRMKEEGLITLSGRRIKVTEPGRLELL